MPTFIKTGLWETSTTAQVPKGWLNLTKLIKDNSGGGTGNYIPLTGTEEGKPIIGDIEILGEDNDLRIKWTNADGDLYNSLYFGSNSVFFTFSSGEQIGMAGNIGISAPDDYSEINPSNKLIYAQRSYVDAKAGIPLTGTEESKPVTGNIIVDNGVFIQTYTDNPHNNLNAIVFDNGISLINRNIKGNEASIDLEQGILSLGGNIYITSEKFENENDVSEVEPTNKLIYAQRSYVDKRGSVLNTTTSVLTLSDLNTLYPDVVDGFSVVAPNVIGGGKYYIKAGTGWVYQQLFNVV